ncbi:MAG: UbiA family prenyltransferase [Candidatus Altiarchaeota archaeon]|nr:UbiA family prenyltransferase [Candidatus Altiarchaeota archaeon]
MKQILKAYIDLTRAHFFFAWPLLFCSGLFLAFLNYGGFSLPPIIKAALIAILGFEAGFVLNDYVDRELDKKDVDQRLTRYWRLFKERPIPSGLIKPKQALVLFIGLVAATTLLILTLPHPNSIYVLVIMSYSYCLEYFYQVRKRNQNLPLAQLLGRTDFALFPVAGYLVFGMPDIAALLYFAFFYLFAMAHLGMNDIIDLENDKARGLKTVTVLYGISGTVRWIMAFTLLHFVAGLFFMTGIGPVACTGFLIGVFLLTFANLNLIRKQDSGTGLKVLPLFHVTMLVYSASIILEFFI